MQAIETKYHGPGYTRGSRVKATCERGSLTVSWDPALDSWENHRRAAKALLDKFAKEDVKEYGKTLADHHWGEFVSGELANGKTVHVLVGRLSGWGLLRKAAEGLEASRVAMKEGKRDGATMGRLGNALDAVNEALEELAR